MSLAHSPLRNERGIVLAILLMFMIIVAAIESSAVIMTRADIKAGGKLQPQYGVLLCRRIRHSKGGWKSKCKFDLDRRTFGYQRCLYGG